MGAEPSLREPMDVDCGDIDNPSLSTSRYLARPSSENPTVKMALPSGLAPRRLQGRSGRPLAFGISLVYLSFPPCSTESPPTSPTPIISRHARPVGGKYSSTRYACHSSLVTTTMPSAFNVIFLFISSTREKPGTKQKQSSFPNAIHTTDKRNRKKIRKARVCLPKQKQIEIYTVSCRCLLPSMARQQKEKDKW